MARIIIILFIFGALIGCGEEHKFEKSEGYSGDQVEGATVTISEDEYKRLTRIQQHERPESQFSVSYFVMSWGLYFAYYVVGIIIGVFIYRDARKQEALAMNVGPIWWAILTIMQAPLGVLAYWIIHHSKFRNESDRKREDAV